MKSKNSNLGLIFAIVSNVSILLCFVIGFLLMFNFKFPDVVSKEDFITYMENKGCSIIDMQEKEEYPGIETYLITDKNSCPYLISYAVFKDVSKQNSFFDECIKDVVQNNANVTGSTSISVNLSKNYYEYSTSGDFYKTVVYNGNSVMYSSVDKKYREDTIDIYKYFDYYYEPNYVGYIIVWSSLFIVLFIIIVSMWGIEKKIRNKGWIALIPFYNIGCLSKDVLGSYLYPLLLIIPVVNVIFMFTLSYKLGKAFNKDSSDCVLTMIFPTIFWPLLAFDDSKYKKPQKNKLDLKKHFTSAVSSVNKVKVKTGEKKSFWSSIVKILKWILTIMFILVGWISLTIYIDEKISGYLACAVILVLYAILLCPLVTDFTKKYKLYSKYKPWIVVILIIINFILFVILPL